MDRATFEARAIARLRQEIPEHLDWLRWHDLPPLLWIGDQAAVDPRAPRGWLVSAERRGLPQPDAELRQAAALFDRGAATTLGAWLLRAWIEHDTLVPGLTEARRVELRAIAERAAQMAARFGRGGADPEDRYRQLLAQEENRSAPSALPHQGLLAIVAVCADGNIAADVERYLSGWQSERPVQCRALLQMLSWIESPAALEVLENAGRLPEVGAAAAESLAARQARASAALGSRPRG